ncbi:MAG: helix-turn-helix domain-containing protein, partial [Kofleriaceae bacterium]|nr:helix-turn-helix domain-containing protein [Kofleriaceae bacterium]
LADFFVNKASHLSEALVPTLVPDLSLLSGESDPAWASNPRQPQLVRLREQMAELDVDYIVLDLASGTRENVLDLFLDADTGIIVSSAEPTSVGMVYRLIKAAFVRSLRNADLGFLAKMSVEQTREIEGGIPAPSDSLALAIDHYGDDSEEVEALRTKMSSLAPKLVLNLARSKGDADLGADIADAASRRFGIGVSYLGPVEYDDAVWVSLRRRRPLLVEHPESRASKCVEKLTRRLLSGDSTQSTRSGIGTSLYELLQVEPTASDEIIRRANRRIRQVYAKDSPVVGGLYRKAALIKLHKRFDHAYEVLMDPIKRRANDATLFPDGKPSDDITHQLPAIELGVAPLESERPEMPPIDESTVYSGEFLRRVREARGLDLRDISDQSKIGMSYLNAIEEESYLELPAAVYVRGFLLEYSKRLGLPPNVVLESYLERLHEAKSE